MSHSDDARWLPRADIETLKTRAAALRRIRAFFSARGVYEVETPLLHEYTVTDPQIESLRVAVGAQQWFLQTSPEFFMKRLLAAGSGAIFQICRVFRDEQPSRLHDREFSMLEWYRPGFDHHKLMREVADFIRDLSPTMNIETVSYAAVFTQWVGLDPHGAALDQLQEQCVEACALAPNSAQSLGRSGCLDLLFSLLVQPRLNDGAFLVSQYPVCQAALARLSADGHHAERFELFINGIEVGNGYHELSDACEQRVRMDRDNVERTRLGALAHRPDEHLLAALASGIGDVAGIAIGVERLLSALLDVECIAGVSTFSDGTSS